MTDARAHSDWRATAKTEHSAYGEMSVHADWRAIAQTEAMYDRCQGAQRLASDSADRA